jgi:RNA polymerase sigma-70 factor (ECF subfamily)
MEPSDAELVSRICQKDAAAFEVLMRRHFRAAFLVAYAQIGSREDAEDVCQDAFLRCWDRMPECRDPARVGSWIVTIVRNAAHNKRESIRVRATEPIEIGANVASPDRPDHAVDRAELRSRLTGALMSLSPVQREVVLLHDLEGWRHAEVASRLGLSETMSRRHLSDARKRLRQLLDDLPTLEPDHD